MQGSFAGRRDWFHLESLSTDIVNHSVPYILCSIYTSGDGPSFLEVNKLEARKDLNKSDWKLYMFLN